MSPLWLWKLLQQMTVLCHYSLQGKIAGQLSFIVGSYYLLKPNGMGTIIGGVNDIKPRTITVIGGGVAGAEATKQLKIMLM